jgi:hypothetical protein
LSYFKWLLGLLMGALLAWRIVILGIADYYAEQEDGAAVALSWYPSHPRALADRALRWEGGDPLQAEQLLRRAAWENPTDGRLFMALAGLREQQGRTAEASELVTLASILAPMHDGVQLQAAEFELRQELLEQALAHWSVALRNRPSLRAQLYPVLLHLAEDPAALPAFGPLLNDPPSWWADVALVTVRDLYKARRRDELVANEEEDRAYEEEQRAYLKRLQRDGQWLELYFTWLNGLEPEQLQVLGNLYNGSFELPFTDAGFDWRAPKVRGVLVETSPTYGVRGKRSLHVVFQGLRVRFQHLYQYLLLDPGQYQLRGWVRPDSLQTERGVRWIVTCAEGNGDPLGVSDRFLGTDQWRRFTVDFEVPNEACQAQLLRLELDGRVALEFEASGSVWFDDLAVGRLESKPD